MIDIIWYDVYYVDDILCSLYEFFGCYTSKHPSYYFVIGLRTAGCYKPIRLCYPQSIDSLEPQIAAAKLKKYVAVK